MLENEENLIWYPAEVNTSIRPGWFWHEGENDKVRSLDELVGIYINSVGGNATFLLNIPPTRSGLFHENDVKRLNELGDFIRSAFYENLLEKATLSSNGRNAEAMRMDNYDNSFITEKGRNTAVILARWNKPVAIDYIVLKENITLGQRVESFTVEAELNGVFSEIYRGTVIGYKRIVPVKNITTDKIRINIKDSRTEPTLAFMGIYKSKKD